MTRSYEEESAQFFTFAAFGSWIGVHSANLSLSPSPGRDCLEFSGNYRKFAKLEASVTNDSLGISARRPAFSGDWGFGLLWSKLLVTEAVLWLQ